MSKFVHYLRMFIRREQAQWFLAGAGFGVLFVALVLFLLACQSSGHANGPMWTMVEPGLTAIQLPCAVIVIEVRANPERMVYWWRIAIIPQMKPIPQKPEKAPPKT